MVQGLKDIKGIVTVADDSLFTLGVVVAVLLLIAIGVTYMIVGKRRVKRRFIPTAKELAKENIEHLNYDDPKNVVYTFGEDVKLFVDEKNRLVYEDILKALEPYKYKKEVPPLDESVKKRIKTFVKEIL